MPTDNNTFIKLRDVYFPASQHLLLNDFMRGTDNLAMMMSVRWKRPYRDSEIRIRGNSTYQALHPHLKDIIQQLAFTYACELKGSKRFLGKMLTSYDRHPTAEKPDPRGSMAMYSKHDTIRNEHDYWVTFGDTGKDNFRTIINGFGAEAGIGDLITPLTTS